MASKAPKTEKLEQQVQAPKQEVPNPPKADNPNPSKQESKIKTEKENNPPKRVEEIKLLGHTRLNEKNALVGLNNRLATIIEKNQSLEKDNANLSRKIVLVEEEKVETLTRVETTYKTQQEDNRQKLADAEKDNQKLKLEADKLKSELSDLKDKLAKRDDEAKKLEERLNKLKKDNDKLESDNKKAKEEKQKLEKEKKNAEESNKKKDKEIGELRADLEKESLAKIDLAGQLRNKESEFTIKGEMLQQEVRAYEAKCEAEFKELDGKRQSDYETKLQLVLDELRAEYELQLQTNKKVQADLYKKKEEDLKAQLDRLKLEVETKTKTVKEVSKKLDEVSEKVAKLEGEKSGLSRMNDELKRKMKEERLRLDAEKKKKDEENLEIQSQKEKLITEYSDLMEIKIMLDNEIATYRTMLEGEEDRLHLNNDENMNVKEKEVVPPVKTAVPAQ